MYRVGDKVTQLRNNYDKDVFNGSVGMVTGLSLEDQELRVFMDETEEIVYDFLEGAALRGAGASVAAADRCWYGRDAPAPGALSSASPASKSTPLSS